MSTPVQDLQKARERLVNIRRRWAAVLAGPYERGEMEAATEQMITVQKAIEAIDAAVADERESSVPASGRSTDDPFGEEQPGG
jgi:hypothetical protein